MFKNVLGYFGKVLCMSNLCILWFDWLVTLYTFTPLPCNTIFLIVKHIFVREELTDVVVFPSDTTSTDHCARTYFWWFHTRAPYLWSVQLPNWQFFLCLPLSVCVHYYQKSPQLHPHFRGRQFPIISMLDQHIG